MRQDDSIADGNKKRTRTGDHPGEQPRLFLMDVGDTVSLGLVSKASSSRVRQMGMALDMSFIL